MSRTRIALVATLLLGLLPATLLPVAAQDADVSFPIAVVALEGSYDVADEGDTCLLVWESAGTPTLRVAASDGTRFRQDLVGGELVTIPDVDDALSCLFLVEVEVPDARRYEVTIEGAELVEIASADLDDLEGAVVLPVEMGPEGRYELAADDYLDIMLDVDGAPRPVETESAEREETPTPAPTPVASAHDGKVIEADLLLFVYEDLAMVTEDGCRIDTPDIDAALEAIASSGVFHAEWSPGERGIPVRAAESPTGESGCVFHRTMRLPGADTYTFTFGNAELATVPYPDLEGMDGAMLLAIDREGNRTPGELVTVLPETVITTETGLEEGQHEVVARVNLWTNSPEDAPFGCPAGPTRTGVYPGAQVSARDGGGEIIGYGTLAYSDRSGATVCSFDLTVTVPEAEFYVFEFGNGSRYVRSFDDLELWNWRLFIDTGWQ